MKVGRIVIRSTIAIGVNGYRRKDNCPLCKDAGEENHLKIYSTMKTAVVAYSMAESHQVLSLKVSGIRLAITTKNEIAP